MRHVKYILLLVLWIAPSLLIFVPRSIHAEELSASGYVPISEAEFALFPKSKRYRAFLPESIDLSSHFPTPGDQGSLGACTAWAVGYAARSYYAKSVEGRKRNSKRDIPSPSFIYNLTREPDNCKSGSKIPDALSLLQKGVLSLADYPYRANCKLPSEKQRRVATDFRIDGFLSVDLKNIDDVKGQLAQGNPVMFGIMANKRLERLRRGQVYDATDADKTPYPHAMTVVGYDDRRQALKVINSWGTRWGDRGFGWIDYDAFSSQTLEAYVMQVSKAIPEPEPKPVVVIAAPPTPEPTPTPAVVEPISPPVVKPTVVVQPAPKPVVKPPTIVQPAPPVVQESVVASDCSKVVSSLVGDKMVISGFVGTEAALAQLRKNPQGPKDKFEVQFRPWPQCEVLMTLETALGSAEKPQLVTVSGKTIFTKADQMALKVTAPKKPAYVYVSYVQADGSVVHLHKPPEHTLAPSLSAKEYLFGDGLEGREKFTVSAPFGHEMVVVVTSASPLFEEELPVKQTEREYLSMLRKALIYKVDPKMPGRDISAAFLGIETRETSP